MNPFIAFCLYVAARVFVQYLKKMPNDQEVRQSLEFLLAAMRVIQGKNPLTESFIVQLKMDIEGSGLNILVENLDYSLQYVEGRVRRFRPSIILFKPRVVNTNVLTDLSTGFNPSTGRFWHRKTYMFPHLQHLRDV